MSFTAQHVAKIAKLARISVTEEEKEKLAGEIGGILKFVEQLSEVDTGDVADVASVVEHTLPMREDVVSDGNYPDRVLANAPAMEYDCFVVPKVIDQG